MARPSRRSIDALFTPSQPAGVTDLADAKYVRLDLIDAAPHQARQDFAPAALAELTASIRERGVIQPIKVRPVGDRYELVAGERRLRAARDAGLTDIPAIVGDLSPEEAALEGLIENLLREDLNPVERAAGLQQLRLNLGSVPWTEVGRRVGLSERRIMQLLDLGKLPPAVQESVRAGALTEKHTRPLKGLEPARQEDLASAIQVAAASPVETAQAARLMKDEPALRAADALTQVRQPGATPRLNPGSVPPAARAGGSTTARPANSGPTPKADGARMVTEHELEVVSLLRTGDGRAPQDEVVAALERDLERFRR